MGGWVRARGGGAFTHEVEDRMEAPALVHPNKHLKSTGDSR